MKMSVCEKKLKNLISGGYAYSRLESTWSNSKVNVSRDILIRCLNALLSHFSNPFVHHCLSAVLSTFSFLLSGIFLKYPTVEESAAEITQLFSAKIRFVCRFCSSSKFVRNTSMSSSSRLRDVAKKVSGFSLSRRYMSNNQQLRCECRNIPLLKNLDVVILKSL